MTPPGSTQITLAEAQTILKQFDCGSPEANASQADLIRNAVLLVAQHSDYQILGICADNVSQGRLALDSYAQALGYKPQGFTPVEGPVYIKFNPRSGLCYADSYNGDYRGVLVSCQSAYESGVNAIYGHLPLTLFNSDNA
jgi:Domain of unknown function (DUF1824)